MKIILNIIFVLVAVFPAYTNAEEMLPIQITKQDVPFQYPEEIVFDEYNRMWFATTDGLYYKQGKEVKAYTTVLDGLESRFSDIIYDPSSKNIYTASTNGVSQINTVNMTSKLIDFDRENIQEPLTKHVATDGAGALYIGSDGLFNEYLLGSKENSMIDIFSDHTNTRKWKDYEIFNMVYSRHAGVYISTVHGIHWFNDKSENVELIYDAAKENTIFSPLRPMNGNFYFIINKDSKQFLATLLPNENEINIDSKGSTALQATKEEIIHLAVDDKTDMIWMASEKAIYSYDPKTNLFKRAYSLGEDDRITYLSVNKGTVYINDDSFKLTSLKTTPPIKYLDKENSNLSRFSEVVSVEDNHFVGTSGGILKITKNGASILENTSNFAVRSITFDKKSGRLLFTSQGAIHYYSLDEMKVSESFRNKYLTKGVENEYWRQNDLANELKQLTIDKDGGVFYETYNEGLWYFDGDNHEPHKSEKDYQHVWYNLDVRYAQETLFIVRQGSSILEIDNKGTETLRQIPGLAIKERHYRKALDPNKQTEKTGVINERYHRKAYVTNDEMWIAYGNGTFSQLNGTLNYADHFDTGINGASCIQHYEENKYFVFDNLAIYMWDKYANTSQKIADLTGKISKNIALTRGICHYANGMFLLGNFQRLYFATLEELTNKQHASLVYPVIAEVLDDNLNPIEKISYHYNNSYIFSIKNPKASFLNIIVEHDNPYLNPRIVVDSIDNALSERTSIMMPLTVGTSTHQWKTYFGLNYSEHPPITLHVSYSLDTIIDSYKEAIIGGILAIVILWIIWVKFVREFRIVNERSNHVKDIASQTIINIDNIEASTQKAIDAVIDKNGYFKRPLSDVKNTLASIIPATQLLRVLSKYKGEHLDPEKSGRFALFELSHAIFISPKLKQFGAPKIRCSESIVVSSSLEPFLYFLSRVSELEEVDLNINVYAHKDTVVIKIEYHNQLQEIDILGDVILKPFYRTAFKRNSVEITFNQIDDVSSINEKGYLDKPLHNTISESRKNILLLGASIEFASENKMFWITNQLLGRVPNARFIIATTSTDYLKITTEHSISHSVYISLYSDDFTILRSILHTQGLNPQKNSAIVTITNRDWCDKAQESGASLVVDNKRSPENIAKLLKTLSSKENVLALSEDSVVEKLHNALDQWINIQTKAGYEKAKVFPRSFKGFCKDVDVTFTNTEISDIEDIVENRVMQYCHLYRIRKFAEHIGEKPDLEIQNEKALFGFGENSRTFKLFKEEFGMTPRDYRSKVIAMNNSVNLK